jgi:ComF family protein
VRNRGSRKLGAMRLLHATIALAVPPFCWACGGTSRPRDPLCLSCRSRLRWLERNPVELAGVDVWAPVAYDGPARALVRGLKFRGAAGLAETMAAQIAACAPPDLLRPPAVLVPVPLHPRRARTRGFNQAERIAAAIGRRAGMRVDDCLRRRGGASRQMGRGRTDRLQALTGAVELRSRVPSQVLLVDDVATTGGTLAVCAEALYAGGADHVAAVAYALTPGR